MHTRLALRLRSHAATCAASLLCWSNRPCKHWRFIMPISVSAMTSEAGLMSQDTDYTRLIQEVLNELRQMEQTPQLVSSPDELEALERGIRQRTDRLGSLLVGHHLQQALNSDALHAEQEQ